VKTTIPKKSTLLRTELQLVFIVRTKVGPTGTTKNPKERIVTPIFKEALHGSLGLNNFAREAINQVDSCKKGFIPKLKRHGGISKQGKTYFNNVPMFVFCITILLMCMGSIYMMRNAHFSKDHIHHPN
jgi:hypothetical protein